MLYSKCKNVEDSWSNNGENKIKMVHYWNGLLENLLAVTTTIIDWHFMDKRGNEYKKYVLTK